MLDNLELVFLLIDEHCDGGIILEVDGSKLAGAVLLRDDEGPAQDAMMMQQQQGGMPPGGTAQQGLPAGVSGGDMTLGQAFMQARRQLMGGMASNDM